MSCLVNCCQEEFSQLGFIALITNENQVFVFISTHFNLQIKYISGLCQFVVSFAKYKFHNSKITGWHDQNLLLEYLKGKKNVFFVEKQM